MDTMLVLQLFFEVVQTIDITPINTVKTSSVRSKNVQPLENINGGGKKKNYYNFDQVHKPKSQH